MEIRNLTQDYAVSPQITPEDVGAIGAAGFACVICNRPDAEIPPEISAAKVRAAVEAAGLSWVENPVIGGAITMENVTVQADAIANAPGPVLAYCASGNRCSIVWALTQAGKTDTDDLIETTRRWGYNLEPIRDQIDRLAQA